ncbi:RagB/SusD family nutrient uptake outer membrane protein [Flavobacterium sp. DG1-102-2]|uniref:RagB/SusD family nutrient uptake outer membrane protein n=1 Tax=Flavobacterium sp. DG1-102-2 TaxID=3081663 RepID=UPI0029495A70|nr:RagB/SusD family nutrient uptake outer membrane protein [Flavobacterium sp. DG1-102-2]MDV6170158.1 RagB/SusD family nutrient uptake outer membrane protein [Flavobacterium sp. DG1-102-2]
MKKIKLFLYIAAAAIMTSACDDAIDITQPSELLPEDTFENVADLQTGILGVYASVPGEDIIVFTSLFTDEVKLGVSNGGQGTDGELAFLLNNNSGDAASIWLSNYTLINRANRLLAGAAAITPVVDVEAGVDETSSYNQVIAEAKTFRAYAHFQLLTFFSPDLKNDSALGVIAVDFIPTTNQKLPRNTNGEVFALIEKDLSESEAALPTGKIGATGYLCRDFITALRARMAVYRGKHDVAEPLIDNLVTRNYTLAAKGTNLNLGSTASLTGAAGSAYVKMFRDVTGGTSEVIFKVIRTVAPTDATGNFYQAWSSVNSTTTGSAFFEVGTALYEKLSPEDIRRAAIIDPTAFPSFNVRPVGKYGESKSVPLLGDIKIFRMSEMRLLKAECRANAGDFTGVATQINLVRAARFGNANNNISVPASAQEAWAAILDERRLELAFEGFRYIDIKRLGQLAGKGIDRNANDYAFNNALILESTDYRFTLPIPRTEQTANPNIQQNPGYSN